MALFGLGKEKRGEGSRELVLAYLEDAQRVRVPFRLADARGREATAVLLGLSEDTGLATFQLQGPLPSDKGARLDMVFILDGLRIGGTCQVAATRSGQTDLALPEQLEVLERRKRPRAKLNPREGATLTALSGLFDGTGMTGIIENLSESGARIKVERAMEIKGERKLSLHTSLIQSGHAFGVIKISKLPRIPGAWECSGRGVYLEGGSAALFLGLAFNSFPAEALGALRSLISGRVATTPSTLPPKARRNPEAEVALAPAAPGPPPAPAPLPAAAVAAAEVNPVAPVSTTAEAETPATSAPEPARNTALQRLRKRARSVLIVATPGNASQVLLVDHLSEEGYGKVQVVATLQELLHELDEVHPHLIFIEDGVAELKGLDLVEALQRVHPELPPLVVALEDISTSTVLAARRLGVGNLMVKPYDLDEAFSAILEGALGL